MNHSIKINAIVNAINGNIRNITIKQIHKLAEKQKWMKRFSSAYDGGLKALSKEMFDDEVKFFVAMDGNNELGFVRINNKTDYFAKYCQTIVWNITDAYVKPKYRSEGVLRKLIEHVLKYENVQMIYLTKDRYMENLSYYNTLGFTKFQLSSNGELGWAFQTSIYPIVQIRNAYFDAIEKAKADAMIVKV